MCTKGRRRGGRRERKQKGTGRVNGRLKMMVLFFRLSKRRSASMSLLEKAERMNFGGSGWSVGHDPKSGKELLIIPQI